MQFRKRRKFAAALAGLVLAAALPASFFPLRNTVNAGESGLVIYVSPDGDDSQDGSQALPVRSLEAALALERNAIAGSDVAICLMEGNHLIREPIQITPDHTSPDRQLTIYGQPGAVLCGGVPVTGWSQESDKIYSAHVDLEEVSSLFEDGHRLQTARQVLTRSEGDQAGWIYQTRKDQNGGDDTRTTDWTPRDDNPQHYMLEDAYIEFAYGSDFSDEQMASLAADVDNLWVTMAWNWVLDTYTLRQVEMAGGKALLRFSQDTIYACSNRNQSNRFYNGYFPEYNMQQEVFTLYNAYALLDEPGEFCFRRDEAGGGTIYLFSEENPQEKNIYAGVSDGFFTISGSGEVPYLEDGSERRLVTNVSIEGLTFCCGTNHTNNDPFAAQQAEVGMSFVENRSVMRPAAVHIDHARGIRFVGNYFHDIDSAGIAVDTFAYEVEIRDNRFEDLGGGAVRVGQIESNTQAQQRDNGPLPEDTISLCSVVDTALNRMPDAVSIVNNRIDRAGSLYLNSPAVTVYFASRVTIDHNTILNAPYSGISVGWGWNNRLSRYMNHVAGGHCITGNQVDSGYVMGDCAPIYTLGYSRERTVISGNYINTNHCENGYFGGIYLDEGTDNVEVTGNAVIGCLSWINERDILPGFYSTEDGQYKRYISANTLVNVDIHDNVFFAQNYLDNLSGDISQQVEANGFGMSMAHTFRDEDLYVMDNENGTVTGQNTTNRFVRLVDYRAGGDVTHQIYGVTYTSNWFQDSQESEAVEAIRSLSGCSLE